MHTAQEPPRRRSASRRTTRSQRLSARVWSSLVVAKALEIAAQAYVTTAAPVILSQLGVTACHNYGPTHR